MFGGKLILEVNFLKLKLEIHIEDTQTTGTQH